MRYDFIDKGMGKTVIMLHGLFGHASNWQCIVESIPSEYRKIALELPYLTLTKENCSVKYLSDYVLRFADSNRIDKAVYMGNSLGGHIAIDIAVKNSGRVEGLILTGSSGLFERTYEEDLQIHPTRAYVKKKIGEIFFDKSRVTDKLIDDVYNILLNKKSKLKMIRLIKSAKGYNVKNILRFVDCPVLLIWGRDDTITPPSVGLEFKKYIKRARLKFVDNCCHAPMMEYPCEFTRMVMEFLKNPH